MRSERHDNRGRGSSDHHHSPQLHARPRTSHDLTVKATSGDRSDISFSKPCQFSKVCSRGPATQLLSVADCTRKQRRHFTQHSMTQTSALWRSSLLAVLLLLGAGLNLAEAGAAGRRAGGGASNASENGCNSSTTELDATSGGANTFFNATTPPPPAYYDIDPVGESRMVLASLALSSAPVGLYKLNPV